MASVYYLFDDALQVADDIVQKYSQQDRTLKNHYQAAMLIQRAYRGYVVRKNLEIMHKAATTLQKYIRGWLVRLFLPERFQEQYDQRCLSKYHRKATKIQAYWKGVQVRREINIKQIMEAKRKAKEQQPGVGGDLRYEDEEKKAEESIHEEEEEDIPDSGYQKGQDKFFKKKILEIMFNRHHLLSTKVQTGILKYCSELTEIEKVLASLSWTPYMKKLRKMYNRYYKQEMCSGRSYMFTNKQLRKQEDLLRLRDRRNDTKEISMRNCVADNRKPFNLNIKPKKCPYERCLLLQGGYCVPEKEIVRTEDNSKNICDKDFKLTLKKIVKESDVQPYYADFWYQQCGGHNFINE